MKSAILRTRFPRAAASLQAAAIVRRTRSPAPMFSQRKSFIREAVIVRALLFANRPKPPMFLRLFA